MRIRPVHNKIAERTGELGFLGSYSAVSIGLLAWMIGSYVEAPEFEMWEPVTGLKHASLTLMLFSSFLIVGGYTTPNPGAFGMEKLGMASGPRGVLKITRHPVMWSVALWSLAHVLANGNLADIIFFGTFGILAIAGASHIDVKKRARLGGAWAAFAAETSHVPLVALLRGRTRIAPGEIKWWQTGLAVAVYAAMVIAHEAVFGVAVWPL